MSRFVVENTALLKILLHSLKYPTTGVNGILLGEERSVHELPAGSPPSSPRPPQGHRVLHVYDAVPVCHSYITLAPVLEAALSQVSAHVKQRGGNLRIAGYYQCNEHLEDVELGAVGKRIADKVDGLAPGSAALVLDGPALKSLLEGRGSGAPVQLLHKEGRGWVGAAASGPGSRLSCPVAGVADLLAAYVEEGRHRRLADFEDHLEDLTADWLNPDLLA